MGIVTRIVDKRLGRDAALKVLKTQSEEMQKRFLRKAQITARLDHPAIPPVYELGQLPEGDLYLLMRVIEGQTLAALIDDPKKSGNSGPPGIS
jgi:eukaryotic-like serine/threonine-protein kinase